MPQKRISRDNSPASSPLEPTNTHSKPVSKAVTNNNAQIMYLMLREQLMAKLATIIQERELKQAEAGRILQVPQSRISDLMRAKAGKFTIDKLIHWLGVLEMKVSINVESNPGGALPVNLQSQSTASETVSYLTKAIFLAPNNDVHYQNRGDAYVTLGKFDLAIGDYTRSIELCPGRPGARIQRINAFRKSGQYKAALHDCDELIRQFGEGYGTRASIYELLGDFKQAMADYNRSISASGGDCGGFWNRGSLCEKLGDYQAALADYSKALALNPNLTFIAEAITALKKKMASKQ